MGPWSFSSYGEEARERGSDRVVTAHGLTVPRPGVSHRHGQPAHGGRALRGRSSTPWTCTPPRRGGPGCPRTTPTWSSWSRSTTTTPRWAG
ncbi:hypothetical protein QJS66_06500 [Kocuria rhizophila]|nr:hypothetical protein QJS66_06500 [Kocuria rhizophila]